MIIFILVNQNSLKTTFKTGFLVHNSYLNLYGKLENSKEYCVVEKQVLMCVFKISDIQGYI